MFQRKYKQLKTELAQLDHKVSRLNKRVILNNIKSNPPPALSVQWGMLGSTVQYGGEDLLIFMEVRNGINVFTIEGHVYEHAGRGTNIYLLKESKHD